MIDTEKPEKKFEFYLWGEMRLMEFDERGRCTNADQVRRLYQEEVAQREREKKEQQDAANIKSK